MVFDPVLGKRRINDSNTPAYSTDSIKERRKKVVRRRTRTGCLTCRKRRIKCDERKPFCYNCEKSKKVCAGYEQVPYGSRRYRYMDQPKPQEIQPNQPILHQGPIPPNMMNPQGQPIATSGSTSTTSTTTNERYPNGSRKYVKW
ncbi:unnamed protein product [Ambrosiozyma monospora]|uniref:Unnamed protein product n=1 Tax=Ambrosiozyma monospora TaxID=43982 RepID=A0ACB5UAM3_AMBMO|nr:unnamed protein product [Ambrosiozyma monospora]